MKQNGFSFPPRERSRSASRSVTPPPPQPKTHEDFFGVKKTAVDDVVQRTKHVFGKGATNAAVKKTTNELVNAGRVQSWADYIAEDTPARNSSVRRPSAARGSSVLPPAPAPSPRPSNKENVVSGTNGSLAVEPSGRAASGSQGGFGYFGGNPFSSLPQQQTPTRSAFGPRNTNSAAPSQTPGTPFPIPPPPQNTPAAGYGGLATSKTERSQPTAGFRPDSASAPRQPSYFGNWFGFGSRSEEVVANEEEDHVSLSSVSESPQSSRKSNSGSRKSVSGERIPNVVPMVSPVPMPPSAIKKANNNVVIEGEKEEAAVDAFTAADATDQEDERGSGRLSGFFSALRNSITRISTSLAAGGRLSGEVETSDDAAQKPVVALPHSEFFGSTRKSVTFLPSPRASEGSSDGQEGEGRRSTIRRYNPDSPTKSLSRCMAEAARNPSLKASFPITKSKSHSRSASTTSSSASPVGRRSMSGRTSGLLHGAEDSSVSPVREEGETVAAPTAVAPRSSSSVSPKVTKKPVSPKSTVTPAKSVLKELPPATPANVRKVHEGINTPTASKLTVAQLKQYLKFAGVVDVSPKTSKTALIEKVRKAADQYAPSGGEKSPASASSGSKRKAVEEASPQRKPAPPAENSQRPDSSWKKADLEAFAKKNQVALPAGKKHNKDQLLKAINRHMKK